ncbi:hypothetical protein [Hymenobacter sp. PAMC 26628]|uniref:hypothetical protein n=1 Tax=Hymenobacter sp. PAMC 26628 TaxID=1484118 RepID=UPI000770068E|nr:hypothetical protein [Hymenobacter sp. PAMC 26628]AMJ67003.1 hypothetical protein AXW84_17365 [Hymenobacter sp. PAMC 26628]
MGNFLRILVAVGALLVTAGEAQAQLDNRAFTSPEPGRTKFGKNPSQLAEDADTAASRATPQAGDLRISLNAFTFFKDNEYFNDIVEGYTLFGTQLNPQLVYYPTKELRLEAGVFLWKDFGNPTLRQVRPTYRATWTHGPHQFIFGNIRANLNHGYIEPLFDFERVILKPLEEGLQYRLNSRRVALDVWVDWLKQEYPGSNYQEQIAGGLSSSFRLTRPESPVDVSVPFQFTARHHGGQIDTLHAPIQTLFNYATGVVARVPLHGAVLQAVRLNAYAVAFDDHSFSNYRLPYQTGNGLYLNGTLETRYLDVMLSYWQGHQFYAPLGGPYYQSIASRYGTPGYTDAERRLLLVRLLRDFRISDAAALTVRVEPVYDFNRQLLDFSFGFYLNFRQEWLLGNVGRRARVGQ